MSHAVPLADARRLLSAGQLEEAEAACREFLHENPRHVAALDLLGRIHCQRGDFQQAIESIRGAIKLQPDNGIFHRNLGFVQFLAGNFDDSIASYRQALKWGPCDAETHNSLGVALRAKGCNDEAIDMFRAAVRQRPELAYAHRNLGELLHQQGKPGDAIDHFNEAIRLAPHDAEIRNGFGLVLAKRNLPAEAVRQFVEAVKLQRTYAEAQSNLTNVLANVKGAADTAAGNNDQRKNMADTLVAGGNSLVRQRRIDEAISFHQQALSLIPDHVPALCCLGATLIERGQFGEAAALLEKSLELAPDFTPAYKHLGDLARQEQHQFTSDQIDRMRTLIESKTIPTDEASTLQFTLGNILELQGKYDEAFRVYQQGNNATLKVLEKDGHTYDAQQQQLKFDRTIDVFTKAFFDGRRGPAPDTETPIFVVGMPRSGTTLVEQIIASHPQASGAGELTYIKQLTNRLAETPGTNDRYPECVLMADHDAIAELAQSYLQIMAERGHSGKRIVDKTPGNFIYLGFIATLFPNARVVHCRRDAMDVCFSCYSCKFAYINWSFRLEDIGQYYRQYERLMRHWREVLPIPMHEIRYEDLVGDQERPSRDLIDFCGLDWDDSCLEYFKNRGTVQTASRVQVRQPIYTSSLGRWKHYQEHLGPLEQSLARRSDGDT